MLFFEPDTEYGFSGDGDRLVIQNYRFDFAIIIRTKGKWSIGHYHKTKYLKDWIEDGWKPISRNECENYLRDRMPQKWHYLCENYYRKAK